MSTQSPSTRSEVDREPDPSRSPLGSATARALRRLASSAAPRALGLGAALVLLLFGSAAPAGMAAPRSVSEDRAAGGDAMAAGGGTWSATGPLQGGPRKGHTATLLPEPPPVGRSVVMAIGAGGNDTAAPAAADTESYDPDTGVWTLEASLRPPRRGHCATLLPDGTVLIAGGDSGPDQPLVPEAAIYSAVSGVWRGGGTLERPRASCSLTTLPDGSAVLIGGGSPGFVGEIERYDPATGAWTILGRLQHAREYHTATLLPDGTVLVAGGAGAGGRLDSLERVNPGTGQSTVVATMGTPRGFHTATLLPDGTVLIAGGDGGGGDGFPAQAERFDPASNGLRPAGSMRWPRRHHTATLLPDGTVLMVGGDKNGPLEEVELYDPADDSWTEAAPMGWPRRWHTATLLPDGTVMVAGGEGMEGPLASAEIFASAPPVCTKPPPGLVGWWPLDEAGGDSAVDRAGGNHGSYVNAPAVEESGFVARSRRFNGTSQSIEVPDAAEGSLDLGTGDFTLDAWVRLDTDAADVRTIFDKRTFDPVRGYALFTIDGRLALQLGDGSAGGSVCGSNPATTPCTSYNSGIAINDGQWHFVAVRVDRDGQGTFFVDEQMASFDPAARQGSLDNAAPLRIARHASSGGFWKGGLDELELVRGSLSAEDLGDIRAAGQAGKCKTDAPEPSNTPTASASATASATASPSPTPTASSSPSPTRSPTATPTRPFSVAHLPFALKGPVPDFATLDGLDFVAFGGAHVVQSEAGIVVDNTGDADGGVRAALPPLAGIGFTWTVDPARQGNVRIALTRPRQAGGGAETLAWAQAAPADWGVRLSANPAIGGGGRIVEVLQAGRMVQRFDERPVDTVFASRWPEQVRIIPATAGRAGAVEWTWSNPVHLQLDAPTGSTPELPIPTPALGTGVVVVRITAGRGSSEGGSDPDRPATLLQIDLATIRRTVIRWIDLLPPESPCGEPAVLDREGNVVFPELAPGSTPVYSEVDQADGFVEELYPGLDTSTDLWMDGFPCEKAIGGDALMDLPDIDAELRAEGIDLSQADLAVEMAALEAEILANGELPELGPLGEVPPALPTPGAGRLNPVAPLAGRDIIFVHGLQLEPVMDKAGAITSDPTHPAVIGWLPAFGSSSVAVNPHFYDDNGYWRKTALDKWSKHVSRLESLPNFDNRYLVVAWPATQRAQVGAHAILTQIAEAMHNGQGVVSKTDKNDFCRRRGCVIVSHSTGGLLVDIGLAQAAAGIYGGLAGEIPHYVKAHVAQHVAFAGSQLATAAVGVSMGLTSTPTLCALANLIFKIQAGVPVTGSWVCTPGPVIATSVLADLVPSVTQLLWAPIIAQSPVPVIMTAGGHPSQSGVIAHTLMPGFDDGVLPMESQCASPMPEITWPNAYHVQGLFTKVFDLGIERERAMRYYIDQQQYTLPGRAATTCLPDLSPSGMLQPREPGTGGDALKRLAGHHSFLMSTSDHFAGPRSVYWLGLPQLPTYYAPTKGTMNWEEVRAVTSAALFQADSRPGLSSSHPDWYALADPSPLASGLPKVSQVTRGRKVEFKIRLWPTKYTVKKTWWLWKRYYLHPEGSATRDEFDYIYQYLLK